VRRDSDKSNLRDPTEATVLVQQASAFCCSHARDSLLVAQALVHHVSRDPFASVEQARRTVNTGEWFIIIIITFLVHYLSPTYGRLRVQPLLHGHQQQSEHVKALFVILWRSEALFQVERIDVCRYYRSVTLQISNIYIYHITSQPITLHLVK
jgi:hypothetical protein